MTNTQKHVSASIMSELYFESLKSLGLMEPLHEVPFHIQCRSNGFGQAQRCLALLASQAEGCEYLTEWSKALRLDSRLSHWMGDRPAPHSSTLSRSLAATDAQTIEVLRRDILVPLSDQAFVSAEATGPWLFVDVDSKGLPAEGKTYQRTSYGRMSDGRKRLGYRLHLLSLANRWPLEMDLTGANEHGVVQAMVLCKRLMHRVSEDICRRIVIRGDSAYGCVRFIRFVQRYDCGYILKGYNASTARRLWRESSASQCRIHRKDQPDLLAKDCGVTTLTGMTRQKRHGGVERRKSVKVTVPRVVVYQEDPNQVPSDKTPQWFCLITTLSSEAFDCEALLQADQDRGGAVENIFSQLDQAFAVTHLRTRSYYGNYTYFLLALIAANLTQQIRNNALERDLPVPAGLGQMVVEAKQCGLSLAQDAQAGCVLHEGLVGHYTATFKAVLRCSYQHRFKYAA